MKIVEPEIKYWNRIDDGYFEFISRCARVCYRSESKNDEKLVEALWNKGHRSMFRHWSVYFIIPNVYFTDLAKNKYFKNNPFIFHYDNGKYIYISTNGQYIKENEDFYSLVERYEVSEERMFQDAIRDNAIFNIIRYTFRVVTQISTSRELNRVSPNNIAEQSTRYVYDDGTLCRPHWISKEDIKNWNNEITINISPKVYNYLVACRNSFYNYNNLIEIEVDKQDARGVLPLDTATVCVYTYSGQEWRHILDLRYRGTTGIPHSNAKIVAEMISNKLSELTNNIIF